MKHDEKTPIIALAGNPNVGKSTLFNALTGLRQHTGNWTGKTVETAKGYHQFEGVRYTLVDLPGVYSLTSRSAEEEAARDFLLSGEADAVIFVCDATALARNLTLLFSILEITPRVVVCLNLMDEARRRGIHIDVEKLEMLLGIPVIPTSAGKKEGISEIFPRLFHDFVPKPFRITYEKPIEEGLFHLEEAIEKDPTVTLPARFLALRLLEGDPHFTERFPDLAAFVSVSNTAESLSARVTETASAIADAVTIRDETHKNAHRVDAIFTSRRFGIPVMLLLLALILWLTVVGANVPSSLLSSLFTSLEPFLYKFCLNLGMGAFWCDLITLGLYRTVTWIIAVMLPPMAIFFPLFTILEDVGYLPRMAYNLDGLFVGCGACGKQGLCMCMGLGCNAVGVTGARIIDSKRERLLSILTAGFMPCNGRFPAMITVAALFFAGASIFSSFFTALILLFLLSLGVLATLLCAKLLSHTFLKGEPSSFVLELPPYRKPRILQILIRSLLDRTLFILGRAISVAAPAGVLIFLLARVEVAGAPILSHISAFLEPLGTWMGLDGEILLAFLLGMPASEIVLPLSVMLYSGSGVLAPLEDLSSLSVLLTANGWTIKTALSFLVFSVLHSPCTTTLLTVKKETGKWRYAALAFLIPTILGILVCIAINLL